MQCSPGPFTEHGHNVRYLTLYSISTLTCPILYTFRLLATSLKTVLTFLLYEICPSISSCFQQPSQEHMSKCLCWEVQFIMINSPLTSFSTHLFLIQHSPVSYVIFFWLLQVHLGQFLYILGGYSFISSLGGFSL